MSSITISDLRIQDADGNWVALPKPAPKGVTMTREKVWSANYGTTASGRIVGTLLKVRRGLEISWPWLDGQDAATIESVAGQGFAQVEYTDISGDTVTMEAEIGEASYTQTYWTAGHQFYSGVKLTVTER